MDQLENRFSGGRVTEVQDGFFQDPVFKILRKSDNNFIDRSTGLGASLNTLKRYTRCTPTIVHVNDDVISVQRMSIVRIEGDKLESAEPDITPDLWLLPMLTGADSKSVRQT